MHKVVVLIFFEILFYYENWTSQPFVFA